MNWISNYVRPKINAIFSKKDTPENLWQKCPKCGMMLFHREIKDNLSVCNGCEHHMLISPKEKASFHILDISAKDFLECLMMN